MSAKQDNAIAARLLLNLSTTAQINDSQKLGDVALLELERVNRLHKPRVQRASFAVLKAAGIPAILVEAACISSQEEELRLRDNAYQQKMAQAIYGGTRRYSPSTRRPPASRSRNRPAPGRRKRN